MIGSRVRILPPHPAAGVEAVIRAKCGHMFIVEKMDNPGALPSIAFYRPKYGSRPEQLTVYIGYVEFLESAVDVLARIPTDVSADDEDP